MKNIKGVSLMALIITIAVTIIILSTVTISGIMVQNNATKIRIASEISYMQEIVDSYIVRSNGEYPVSNEILFNLSALDSKFLNQFEGEIKNENNISLYEIDRNLLGKSETIYGNKKDGDLDIYAMSKDTNRVYYLKGLIIEDVIYYTLTDDLKKIIGYTEKEENYKKDGISFKPTTNTWTNNKINTEISVPKSYTDINVVVKQNNSNDISVSLSRQEDDNNIYVAENILNNYTIFVSYKKENMGENITQTYEVNIFDNLAPNITISEQKNIANGSTQYAYFNILSKTDNLSGIKIIKYAFEKISEEDAKEYFRTKGTIVNNDIIEIYQMFHITKIVT